MAPFVISASGVRGVVGKGLTPEIVVSLSSAFGSLRKGKILVGYDTRTSNQMFKCAAFSGLLSVGCEVVDAGVCPTPSLQFMVKEGDFQGGIAITGSHNPVEWNALKFIRNDGLFLFPEEGERLIKIHEEKDFSRVSWNALGKISKDKSAIERHIGRILEVVNVEKIRKKGFKVVIDACNGAASYATPMLLEKLGCEVIKVNCEPNGIFPHLPEPVPSNLTQLCEVVKNSGANIGFAHDPDADRLAIVSEKGEAISEEYTLVLIVDFILQSSKGPVVTNICTSQAIDEVARKYNCPVKRTKVGDIHVSRFMKDCGAVVGGEGNGGVIFPPVNYARDGITAVALILNYMAEEGVSISSLIDKLPQYYMFKRKIDISNIDFNKIKEEVYLRFDSTKLNFLDGVKIWLEDGWVHIRPSGTEPILRIIGEGVTSKAADRILNWTLNFISKFYRKKQNANNNCS